MAAGSASKARCAASSLNGNMPPQHWWSCRSAVTASTDGPLAAPPITAGTMRDPRG